MSGLRPTETKKFTPIFDFMEIGGDASSVGNVGASEAGGEAVERITLPCGEHLFKASLSLFYGEMLLPGAWMSEKQ